MNSIYKIIVISFLIFSIILGGIIFSTNILKTNEVKNQIKIADFHSKLFSEQLTLTFNNIDHLMSDFKLVVENSNDDALEEKFNNILSSNSYIRSINILDENNKILKSTNSLNIGYKVETENFYPIPIFDKYILRFGELEFGRDISQEDGQLEYIPVSKLISTKKGEYIVVLAINIGYFINRYIDTISNNLNHIDIIRVDGKILFSTNKENKLKKNVVKTELYKSSIEKNFASGEELIGDKKYLTSYYLSELYPLNIAIKLSYEKSLENWEKNRLIALLILGFLVFLSIVLVAALVVKYAKSRNKELLFEKEKNRSRKRFQVLFEQNNFLISIVKPDGTILQVNHKVKEFLGKMETQIIGSKFYNLSCWDDENKNWFHENVFCETLTQSIKKDILAQDKNNLNHYFDIEVSLIEYEGNIELVVLGNNITQEKLKEDKLQNAYIVYENTNDGILITDKDIKIVDINKAFTKNTGYTLDQIRGKNPNILKSQRHDEIFYKNMWNALEKENFWHGEIINKNIDGTFYVELLTINRILEENGEVKNYIAVFTNITKQKQQAKLLKEKEQILFQQSKMASMGEMLENIAHQWRQPLSVISTAASGIQVQKEFELLDEKQMDNSLELIVTTVDHLSHTIDDFRNFFRQDKEKCEFLLGETVDKALNIVSSKFNHRGIIIDKNIVDIVILGFENELVQAVMNILNNARDVLEDKDIDSRIIIIKTFIEDGKGYLTIQDSGGGISENILDKIFEPYFTTKHKSQGTGIGLYMTAEMITKHMNGKISVKNNIFEYKNIKYNGALFSIMLPLESNDIRDNQ